jgi:hypothetical protein
MYTEVEETILRKTIHVLVAEKEYYFIVVLDIDDLHKISFCSTESQVSPIY